VSNSRYLDFDHLKKLMLVLGFALLEERWREGGKMGYWLYHKKSSILPCGAETHKLFTKKEVLREGSHRNNFTILL
jgi:25S rRNA (adenine2142-N1)-methyltransferase